MANDINSKVAGAKSTLAHANAAFPSPKPAAAPAAKPGMLSKIASAARGAMPESSTATSHSGSVQDENRKAVNEEAAKIGMKGAPIMHNGGPVMKDGVYQLKKGEHVLTEPEAKMARKHAFAAAGMKSLAKAGPKTSGEPTAVDSKHKAPEKKMTSDIKVRPEKNQAAKIKVTA